MRDHYIQLRGTVQGYSTEDTDYEWCSTKCEFPQTQYRQTFIWQAGFTAELAENAERTNASHTAFELRATQSGRYYSHCHNPERAVAHLGEMKRKQNGLRPLRLTLTNIGLRPALLSAAREEQAQRSLCHLSIDRANAHDKPEVNRSPDL
jgi:hypothetical protein